MTVTREFLETTRCG